MTYKVSVIVPIYKVEAFIARCAESLLSQTLREVEFIFVNDATPDASMFVLEGVLASHEDRRADVKFISHERNLGLPAARNSGLAMAQGEYVFHCDSDDYADLNMLAEMYAFAVNHRADIVWCDWYLSYERRERYMKQPAYDTATAALKAMLSGSMKYNVWNKLVRRQLYVDGGISFPAGYGMGEDMTMMKLFAYADRVAYMPQAFYHYVKLNTGAFSQTYSLQHLKELRHNVSGISDFVHTKYGENLEKELSFLKLEAKFPLLISNGSGHKYVTWRSWYPEANPFIMQNKAISLRSRLVQWFAWKGQWWIVWLYYQLVMRLIYGIIYR